MRKETADWLEPMMEELDRRPEDQQEIGGLMAQASMPAAEGADPVLAVALRSVGSDPATRAIDWIRFGQLLKARLGWDWYPDFPG
jgi:hypothetical protein